MIKFTELLLLLFMLFNTHILSANDKDEDFVNELKFGIKAGVNFSTLNGKDAYQIDYDLNSRIPASSKLGATLGCIMVYTLSPNFDTQLEVLFSAKGVNFDANDYLYTWSLWYIEIPLLFKSKIKLENSTNASLYIGPALGYNIKSTKSQKQNNQYIFEDEKMNGIETFDFSAVIGGSAEMKMFGNNLGIDLRYIFGMSNVISYISEQNGTISATLYYLF